MRVWLIAGILCLLYYGVIALYAGPDADFAWFWIVLGAVFFLFYGRDRSLLIQRNFVPEALHKAAAVVVCGTSDHRGVLYPGHKRYETT